MTLITDSTSGKLRFQPMGVKLYGGRLGVALFFATLGGELHNPSEKYSRIVELCLYTLKAKLNTLNNAKRLFLN